VVSNFVVEKASVCRFRNCQKAADGTISHQTFCREHVLVICRERLDAAAALLQDGGVQRNNALIAREFVVECSRAAQELLQGANDLAPLEQAKIMEIFLRVEDLSQRLMRVL
jgi:hypothetical protein